MIDLEASTKRTVSLKAASDYLSVHPRTVQRWCELGYLTYDVLPSGRRRIHRLSVIAAGQRAEQHAS